MHIYAYIYIYIYIYMHMHIYAYMYIYIHTCIHAYIHVCMHTHTHTHIYICKYTWYTHTWSDTLVFSFCLFSPSHVYRLLPWICRLNMCAQFLEALGTWAGVPVPMYRCMDGCMYVFICMHTYVVLGSTRYLSWRPCIHVFMYVCIYVYVHICVCVCPCDWILAYAKILQFYCEGIFVYMYVCMYVCMYGITQMYAVYFILTNFIVTQKHSTHTYVYIHTSAPGYRLLMMTVFDVMNGTQKASLSWQTIHTHTLVHTHKRTSLYDGVWRDEWHSEHTHTCIHTRTRVLTVISAAVDVWRDVVADRHVYTHVHTYAYKCTHLLTGVSAAVDIWREVVADRHTG
jgi:hypothetical protein